MPRKPYTPPTVAAVHKHVALDQAARVIDELNQAGADPLTLVVVAVHLVEHYARTTGKPVGAELLLAVEDFTKLSRY